MADINDNDTLAVESVIVEKSPEEERIKDQRPSVRSRIKLVTSYDRTKTKLEYEEYHILNSIKLIVNIVFVILALAMAIWLVIERHDCRDDIFVVDFEIFFGFGITLAVIMQIGALVLPYTTYAQNNFS